jgi:hypothetical protein
MIGKIIQVEYTCALCGLKDVKLNVLARHSEEPVKEWMDNLIRVVSINHWHRSGGCKAETMTSLKIPINQEPDTWIGAPVESKVN